MAECPHGFEVQDFCVDCYDEMGRPVDPEELTEHGFRPASEYLQSRETRQATRAERCCPWGIQYLEDQLEHLYANDFVLIGADTGVGKTTLGTNLALNGVTKDRTVAQLALEADEGEVQDRMVYGLVREWAYENRIDGWDELCFGNWSNGLVGHQFREVSRRAEIEVNKITGSKLWMRYRADAFTAADAYREIMAIGKNADMVVLDHVHYIDAESVAPVAAALRQCSKLLGKPIVAVSHLRKRGAGTKHGALIPSKDDFHGASELVKEATRIIVLARAWDFEPEKPHFAKTYMSVLKDRPNGRTGLVALLDFNLNVGRYEKSYELGRLNFTGDEWKPLWREQVPRWCSYPDNHDRQPMEGK